ncbi:MAG TPA: hypothetical protein VHW03_09855, partial [Chthoniobacterales bacterium]|nr:hypothetical protein [Chthoniobacterales bacterium]
AFALLLAGSLGSCGQGNNGGAQAAATPVNEVDAMLDGYEKAGLQCRKMAKKLHEGDVSVTILFLNAGDDFRQYPAKHAQLWAKMTPAQAQRAAQIAAKTAPDLPK